MTCTEVLGRLFEKLEKHLQGFKVQANPNIKNDIESKISKKQNDMDRNDPQILLKITDLKKIITKKFITVVDNTFTFQLFSLLEILTNFGK